MGNQKWVTLVVASVATAILLLDVTIVYVALPSIRVDLGASFDQAQWVIDAYTVLMAATLLAFGSLADRMGRRKVFAGGLLLFTICSGASGLAGNAVTLDVARAFQGIGAAAMYAASLAILANEFQGKERGLAFGVWGAVTGAALAVGPLVGGVVIDGLSWRWIFLVNVPIGVATVIVTLLFVRESVDDRKRSLDLAGMVLFALSTFLLVLGLIRGNEEGWGSPQIVGTLALSIVFGLAFVLVEMRSREPMLPMRFFRSPPFTGTAIVSFAQSIAIYPLLLFLAIYLQDGLGYRPTEAGLRLLPMTVMIFIVAPFAGKLTSRATIRLPLATGLLLLAVSLMLIYGIDESDEWTRLLPGMLVGGISIGLISPSLAAAMVSVLPVEKSGLASGINNTGRQLGIAIGIAGLGAIFDHQVESGATVLAGIAAGLNSVILVAAATAALAAVICWPLLGGQRSSENAEI